MGDRSQTETRRQIMLAIYEAANGSFESAPHRVQSVSSEKIKDIFETKALQHLQQLAISEKRKDLLWMDYDSWYHLPEKCRQLMKKLLNPLFSNGVYFQYSKFQEFEDTILQTLDCSGYLYLLREYRDNYFLMWVGIDSKYPDWLKRNKVQEFSQMFKERLVKSYGKDAKGRVVVKHRNSEKQA